MNIIRVLEKGKLTRVKLCGIEKCTTKKQVDIVKRLRPIMVVH